MAEKYQSRIIKKLKKRGWLVTNIIRTSPNGMPDVLAIKEGVTLFIECKESNDTLKPLQKYMIEKLRASGVFAFCLKDKKGIIL